MHCYVLCPITERNTTCDGVDYPAEDLYFVLSTHARRNLQVATHKVIRPHNLLVRGTKPHLSAPDMEMELDQSVPNLEPRS